MPLKDSGDNDFLAFFGRAKVDNAAKIKMPIVHANDELILMLCNQRKEIDAIFASLAFPPGL